MRLLWTTALALAALLAPVGPAGAEEDGLCRRFGRVSEAGRVGDPSLTEISGLAASRAHPGVLWAHDDSGGGARLGALDAAGRPLGTYVVAGASARDWEDLAVGPGPAGGRSYLYVGDIGDNQRVRASVVVYRVPEPTTAPDGAGGTLVGAEALRLAYPDGPDDAESLVVDPERGDLYILTKQLDGAYSRVLRAEAASLRPGAAIPMQEVARINLPVPDLVALGLPGTMATAADVSPDGRLVLVRTYRSVLAYARPAGEALDAAFDHEPCHAPQAEEPQGEAVAFTADGSAYLTVSEGERMPIHRVAVATAEPDDAPARVEEVVEDATEMGRARRFAIGAAAAVVGAGLALWATSRRRAVRRRARGADRG